MKKIILILSLLMFLISCTIVNKHIINYNKIPFSLLSDFKADKIEIVKFGDLTCELWNGKFIVFTHNGKSYNFMFKPEHKFALIEMNTDNYPFYVWLGIIQEEVLKVFNGDKFENILEQYPMPCNYFDKEINK